MDDDENAIRRLGMTSQGLYAVWATFHELCLSKPHDIASSIVSVCRSIQNGSIWPNSSVLHIADEKYIGINYYELLKLIWLRCKSSFLDIYSEAEASPKDEQALENAFDYLRWEGWVITLYEDNGRVMIQYP